jgi:hypothetical protein
VAVVGGLAAVLSLWSAAGAGGTELPGEVSPGASESAGAACAAVAAAVVGVGSGEEDDAGDGGAADVGADVGVGDTVGEVGEVGDWCGVIGERRPWSPSSVPTASSFCLLPCATSFRCLSCSRLTIPLRIPSFAHTAWSTFLSPSLSSPSAAAATSPPSP